MQIPPARPTIGHQRSYLIRTLIYRELVAKYRGSYLGIVWSLLNPLLFLAAFTLVFGHIFDSRWRDPAQGLAHLVLQIYCGLIVFNFFAETLGTAPRFLLGYQSFIKKTVFPTEILPLVLVATTGIHALVNLTLLLLAAAALGLLHAGALLLPLALLPLLLLSLGLAWIFSATGVYIRDLAQAMPVAVQLLLFLSPVFYPLSAVPASLHPIYLANPLTYSIGALRDLALLGTDIDWTVWLAQLSVGILCCAAGYAYFRSNKQDFADVL